MKRLFALAGVTLLGACSPAGPVIRAEVLGADVVFRSFEADGWLFASKKTAALVVDRFAVFSRDGAVWIIERTDARCPASLSHPSFPITYGRVPPCFTERLPAKPLAPGVIYRTDIGQNYRVAGYAIPSTVPFRLKRGIDTLSDDEQLQAWDWPHATHPDTTHPPPAMNLSADPENAAMPEPRTVPTHDQGSPTG